MLRDHYLPQLLDHLVEKRSPDDEFVIKSCDIKAIGEDGTFMMTICNRVRLEMQKRGDETQPTQVFNIVVKVRKLIID